jgi:hypothetical protein
MGGFISRGLAAAALAAGAIGLGAARAVPAILSPSAYAAALELRQRGRERQRAAAHWAAPVERRRSKNPPTKRRLRANRLHISRRVRRRHRRAR